MIFIHLREKYYCHEKPCSADLSSNNEVNAHTSDVRRTTIASWHWKVRTFSCLLMLNIRLRLGDIAILYVANAARHGARKGTMASYGVMRNTVPRGKATLRDRTSRFVPSLRRDEN